MHKGEKHVVFARLFDTVAWPPIFAHTEAFMLPEGLGSKDKTLIKRLNQFFNQS